jgi:hypothetical protein
MCSLLGLPFANGLIPQAPLHVYSLATIKETYEERKKGDVLITKRKEVWTNVYENRCDPSFSHSHRLPSRPCETLTTPAIRVSPLMQSALIGIVLAPYLLETVGRIPRFSCTSTCRPHISAPHTLSLFCIWSEVF